MALELEKWDQPLLTVVLDQASQPDRATTLRLALESLEDRDLVALTLRFFVARHCSAAAQGRA